MDLKDLKDKYAIAGIGYTPQGVVPGRTALSFYIEACANAIKDAGLKSDDIDGLICYRTFPGLLGEDEVTTYLLAEHLGISPTTLSQEANCCRGQLLHAMCWLELGLCKHVLIVYADNAATSGRLDVGHTAADNGVFGHFGYKSRYAMAARRAMHLYGTGPHVWREIAVGQRQWANLNPIAIKYNEPLSYEDYDNSAYTEEPFRIHDLFIPTDGGRACIVTSLERARNLRNPPAVIMGTGQGNPSRDYTCMEQPTGAKLSGKIALEMASIKLEDIDACEIYDCFTSTVDSTLKDYGFYGPGEALDWFKGGTITPGGRMPVNTSGGLLYEAYYMGLGPLTEAAMQLMGRCGERQLGPKTNTKQPEIILCSDNGGLYQTCATTILRRL